VEGTVGDQHAVFLTSQKSLHALPEAEDIRHTSSISPFSHWTYEPADVKVQKVEAGSSLRVEALYVAPADHMRNSKQLLECRDEEFAHRKKVVLLFAHRNNNINGPGILKYAFAKDSANRLPRAST
jgi:hypothetical protein